MLLTLWMTGSAMAMAQPADPTRAPAPRPAATSAERVDAAAVVAEVRRIIRERYVLPEQRPALDAVLAEGLASGRYRTSDPAVLAERLDADLKRVGNDRHLGVSLDPRRAAMLTRRGPQMQPDINAFEQLVRSRNHGMFELKLLPGNVRYMNYHDLDWIGTETREAVDRSMAFLAGGDAIIIDLRATPGGSPEAVQYFVSHFMEGGRPLITFFMNGVAAPDRLQTLAAIGGQRLLGKPLYVLTSGATGSAAEELAGHVGGYRLGELIGENTAGAGFRNELEALPGGLILSVSVGRAVLASTGRDWEATGIAPTIAVPAEHALQAAQAHALRRLAATADGPRRAQLEGLAQGLAALTAPGTPAAPLTAYAGTFGGRSIVLENGALLYRFEERPRRQLVPVDGNEFTFADDPGQRLRFRFAGGRAAAFEMGMAGGPALGIYERSD